jgi:hypothetical protein
MSDSDDHLTEDVNAMLTGLRAAQVNAPSIEALTNAVNATLARKNQLIQILAEAVMTSDCECPGCVQMREIICTELEVQLVFANLDPSHLDKCTVQ